MKKLIGIVGKDVDFINKVVERIEEIQAVDVTISANAEILDVLSEVYPLKKTKYPLPIMEHHVRLFNSKIRRGIYAVRSGPQMENRSELFNYYKKLGAKRWGENWNIEELITKILESDKSVYLIKDLDKQDALLLKKRFGNFFGLVEAVSVTTKTNEDGTTEEVDEPSDVDADVTIKATTNTDELKTETNKLLTELKTKWNKLDDNKQTTT